MTHTTILNCLGLPASTPFYVSAAGDVRLTTDDFAAAVACRDDQYRQGMPDVSIADSSGVPIAAAGEISTSSGPLEVFPGAVASEILSVNVYELLGPYEDPGKLPELQWIVEQACFEHVDCDKGTTWEYVLNLSMHFDSVPEKLRSLIDRARSANMAYIFFHQGT